MDHRILASLKQLQQLFTEFFDVGCSNNRKREIENELQGFRSQPDFWQVALEIISNCDYQHVLMFCFQSVHTVVQQKLVFQSDTKLRNDLRQFFTTQMHRFNVPTPGGGGSNVSFLLNKSLNVLAVINCFDDPTMYSPLFAGMIEVIHAPATTELGLKLARATVEEFVALRSGKFKALLNRDRRNEIFCSESAILLQSLRDLIWSLIMDIFQRLYPDQNTHQLSSATYAQLCGAFITASPSKEGIDVGKFVTGEKIAASVIALDTISLLFQILPLSNVLTTDHLLDALLVLSIMGTKTPSSSSFIGIPHKAVRCLNELIILPFPKDSLPVLNKVFHFQCEWLAQAASCLKEGASNNGDEDTFDDEYTDAVLEYLYLFFQHKCHIFEKHDQIAYFLGNAFEFTVSLDSLDHFERGIDCWLVFLDHLATKFDETVTARSETDAESFQKYVPFLVHMEEIYAQALLSPSNQILLDRLGMEIDFTTNDVSSSEWHQFTSLILKVFGKLSDLIPSQTFLAVAKIYEAKQAPYLHLETLDLVNLTTLPSKDLTFLASDLLLALQVLDATSGILVSQSFNEYFSITKALVENLCRGMVYSGKMKFYTHQSLPPEHKHALTGVFAAHLVSYKACSHWIAQLYAEAQRSGEHNLDASAIVTAGLDVCIPLLDKSVPKDLHSAAVSVLYSILTTVRPHYVLSMPAVTTLYENAINLQYVDQLDVNSSMVLHCSLCNFLILPWHNAVDCEQEWKQRIKLYTKLVNAFTDDYVALAGTPGSSNLLEPSAALVEQAIIICDRTAILLHEMLTSIANENSKTKKFAQTALKPTAEATLKMIVTFQETPKVVELLLNILHDFLNAIPVQLGSEYLRISIETLIASKKQRTERNRDTCVADKTDSMLLRILTLVVKEMSRSLAHFTTKVITLVIENIHPNMSPTASVDIKMDFYALVATLIDVKWRYFFAPGGVISTATAPISASNKENVASNEWSASAQSSQSSTASTGSSYNTTTSTETERGEHFVVMIRIMTDSLYEDTPSLVKQNLAALNAIDKKWGLYKKPRFVSKSLLYFLETAFNSLVAQSAPNSSPTTSQTSPSKAKSPGHKHDGTGAAGGLVGDELIETISLMCLASDNSSQTFLHTFLPQWLTFIGQPQMTENIVSRLRFEKNVPTMRILLEDIMTELNVILQAAGFMRDIRKKGNR